MLQATVLRTAARQTADLKHPEGRHIIVCNELHRFSVAEQMNAIRCRAQIILEPHGRNTAPAIALAALHAAEINGDIVLLVLPSDHLIQNASEFRRAVSEGVSAANSGGLVTFGVVPSSPESGYGYIQAETDGLSAVSVKSFIEKPDLETAEMFLKSGSYFWNSGMFAFRASEYISALRKHAPDILNACKVAMATKSLDGDFVRPNAAEFSKSPSDSIDYAVMEKCDSVKMVPLDAGWSDVGSWAAMHDVSEQDDNGNSISGDAVLQDCEKYIGIE